MECIVNSALASWTKYRANRRASKGFCNYFYIGGLERCETSASAAAHPHHTIRSIGV